MNRYIEEDSTDKERDLPNRRVYKLDTNKIIVERSGPFGWWYVHFEHGSVPKRFESAFLGWDQASAVIEAYLRDNKKKVIRLE